MSTILVIDDQPLNRKYLVTLLGHFGHKATEAADGVEALESLKNGKISLVIADVLMPTMDGYEFLQRLRSEEKLGDTPVIFYSAASYEPESRAMAEAHGVRHFLTKPAEPEVILTAVNSALGKETLEVSSASLSKFHRHVLSAPADPIDPNAVILVVDDDPAILQMLSAIARDACLNIELFPSAEEFLENYDETRTGCLVLDIRLPGMSGLELLELLRSRKSQMPAIILTGHGNTATAVGALRLRAMDFLEKPVDRRILLTRIYRALQEDSIRHRERTQSDSIRQRMASLTSREKDLLRLLTLGRTSEEIAAHLHISVKTVSHHRAHLMSKTDAENLADLVRKTMIALED